MDTTINCGCLKCNVPCAPFRGPFETCLRQDAYEKKLEERGYARFEPLAAMDVGFIPATPQQIAGWASWLSTPEAAHAAELLNFAESSPAYKTHRFDVVAVERHVDNLFPEEKANFLIGPMWLAYQLYMREQHELKKAYDSVKKNIKTDEAYETAEEAYKTLLQHINTHGQLIRELPEYEHKKPVQPAPPAKLRRRGQ
jgi:hypothetical protein